MHGAFKQKPVLFNGIDRKPMQVLEVRMSDRFGASDIFFGIR